MASWKILWSERTRALLGHEIQVSSTSLLRMNSTSLHLNSPNQTHHTAKQTQRENMQENLFNFPMLAGCAGFHVVAVRWSVRWVCVCVVSGWPRRDVWCGNGRKIIQDEKERAECFRSGLVVEAGALSCVQNRLAHVSLSTIIYFHSPLSSLICSLIQQFALLACSGSLVNSAQFFILFFCQPCYRSISMIVSSRKYHITGEVENLKDSLKCEFVNFPFFSSSHNEASNRSHVSGKKAGKAREFALKVLWNWDLFFGRVDEGFSGK